MMVKSFLTWMDQAGPNDRAQAVDMLARAYLSRMLGSDRPEDVEAALTSILDDPAPLVRKTLALAFADRRDAPRHIVLSLAADQPQVGAILIARSPLLTEPDLVELAFAVEGMSLAAIAMRPEISERVARVIVKRGVRDCALALMRNPRADIAEDDLAALASQFGQESDIREALLARENLPAVVRYILVTIVAKRLGSFAEHGGFLAGPRGQRVMDETIQSAVLSIGEKHASELPKIVAHLRVNAELTPSLLLRSVLGGDLGLLVSALAELTDLDLRRIEALMQARTDAALAALCRRAELPGFLFRPLIAAIRAAPDEERPSLSGLSLTVIRAAQSACIDVPGEEGVRLLALLRRYEAEGARAQSRQLAEDLRTRAREEFSHFTLRADQVRLLEELDTEERLGSIRDYREIAFDPDQIIDLQSLPEEPMLAVFDARQTVIEEADLSSEPPVPAADHWVDLAAADLAREAAAKAKSEPVEEDPWALRADILPDESASAPVRTPETQLAQDDAPKKAVDLKALIQEWRREREARDAESGIAVEAGMAKPAPANEDAVARPAAPRTTFGLKVA